MTFRTLMLLRRDASARIAMMLVKVTSHDIALVAEASHADALESTAARTTPDLIFYDPSLDEGAYLLKRQANPNSAPVVVCYTSDVRYAVDAFEAGAVHYLLSHADAEAVETALDRAARRMLLRAEYLANGDRITYTDRHKSSPLVAREPMAKVIALPLQNGIDIRPCDQIVHVHGEGSYARVIFQRDPSVIVSRSIGDCEETLQDRGFLRVHRSHLVNLVHVRRVLRGKQQRICMSNGDEVEVSERHREQLMEHLHVIGRKRR